MMMSQLKVLFAGIFFSCVVLANGVPVDKDGDTIPSPTGNIAYFSLPGAMAADDNEYTWDYSGTLKNSQQLFSFQATIFHLGTYQKNALFLNMFSFGFQDAGHWFYSSSTYGGDDQAMQAIAGSLYLGHSSATLEHFSVSTTLIANPGSQWKVVSLGAVPEAPLYKGWVGQPGRQYELTGNGRTYLWRYNKSTGKKVVQPYTYTFSVDMLDTRGVTMEGLADAFAGAALVPAPTSTAPVETQSQIAQPRLRVLNWHVTFAVVGAAPSGFKPQYDFSGGKGMLWNDIGPVDMSHGSAAIAHNPALQSLIQSALPGNTTQFPTTPQNKDSWSLYDGNWIPIQFTKGKYAGASLTLQLIWNKTQAYPTDQSTSNMAWSNFGWCDYFSGLIPNEIDSATASVETLYPENPAMPSPDTTEVPPYQAVINQYVPRKYGSAFPWAQHITFTIKANTPLRYQLAAYANQLAKSTTADDPNHDLVITISAVYPVTENTLFTKSISQYYEGVAIPTIDGQDVGYSWIEHMV